VISPIRYLSIGVLEEGLEDVDLVDVASVDDVGLDQPPDDGINEEHTIDLDVPHPLPATVTSSDSPHKLYTVPLDLPLSIVN
jgi:hypothetical protein